MAKFEAHMTYERKWAPAIGEISDVTQKKSDIFKWPEAGAWAFSQFDADPVMGDKPYCYLTSYDIDEQRLLYRMNHLAGQIFHNYGLEPLRLKIERIIFDSKTGVNELG